MNKNIADEFVKIAISPEITDYKNRIVIMLPYDTKFACVSACLSVCLQQASLLNLIG